MRLIFVSIHSAYAHPRLMEYLRSISSGAWSVSAVPSLIDPWRLLAPDTNASASTRVVLPQPPCPTTATLRISELVYSRIRVPSLWLPDRLFCYATAESEERQDAPRPVLTRFCIRRSSGLP